MKLRQSVSAKTKLSATLRSWLPILQSDLESLKETLDEQTKDNPYVQILSPNESLGGNNHKRVFNTTTSKNALSNEIEALSISKKSLHDILYEQIVAPLFPTDISKNIAYEIIHNINDDGYFDGCVEEICKKLSCTKETFHKVRKRFAYLEPQGIGSIDLKESFLFQLNDFDLDNDTYSLCLKIINDMENLDLYKDNPNFNKALKIIKKFKNPPAIDFKTDIIQIIPDIFIVENSGNIEVKLNDSYYPEIVIDQSLADSNFEFVKQKIKSAKQLIDAIELRKATLLKIGLMIVEYQYEFFTGGAIKPMKLDDLAKELDRHHSTISRAISNKYISCERGIFPIKSFFATSLGGDDVSNSQIKSYIQELIQNENRQKPLSDSKILEKVQEKFNIKIGRRTVTKYRIQANIVSSGDRKKLYAIGL